MIYIYSLIDPRDKQVRYIGITNCPENRLYQHMNEKVPGPKYDWACELKALGLIAEMKILHEVEGDLQYETAINMERKLIIEHLANGCSLLNLASRVDRSGELLQLYSVSPESMSALKSLKLQTGLSMSYLASKFLDKAIITFNLQDIVNT